MHIPDVIARLGEPVLPKTFEPHWAETLAADDGSLPDCLVPASVTRNRRESDLPDEAEAPLQETARRVAADPALRLLARHAERLLFEHEDYNAFGGWPSFEPLLGDLGAVFYLLLLVAAAPRIRQTHARLGIPEDVTRATCGRRDPAARFRVTHQGRWGADRRSLHWVRHHAAGRLFRLGRMEYILTRFRDRLRAFRHVATGAVAALAPDGARFTQDGYMTAPPLPDDPEGWTASLRIEPDAIRGCLLSPRGMALRGERVLPRAAWTPVLAKDDWVLDLHIPPGGGMTLEACGASMRQAAEFYPRYFPEQPAAAIVCTSWIFNPQLDGILAPDANLVRFQREVYLHPIPSSGQDGLVFIFDRPDVDPKTAPRETSLQRAILAFLETGQRWRAGGMVFLLADLPRFGGQVYQRAEASGRWPA